MLWLYGVPTDPRGSWVRVIVSGAAGLAMSVSAFVAELPLASVTFATKLNVPAVEGVPEIEPVCASDSPGGRDPLSISHADRRLQRSDSHGAELISPTT